MPLPITRSFASATGADLLAVYKTFYAPEVVVYAFLGSGDRDAGVQALRKALDRRDYECVEYAAGILSRDHEIYLRFQSMNQAKLFVAACQEPLNAKIQ